MCDSGDPGRTFEKRSQGRKRQKCVRDWFEVAIESSAWLRWVEANGESCGTRRDTRSGIAQYVYEFGIALKALPRVAGIAQQQFTTDHQRECEIIARRGSIWFNHVTSFESIGVTAAHRETFIAVS